MDLKPGSRWKSAVCATELVVVRPPRGVTELTCGGAPLLPMTAEKPADGALSPDHSGGTLVGKRYTDETSGIELLCSKGGAGSLAIDGRPLELKEAKKLPASD